MISRCVLNVLFIFGRAVHPLKFIISSGFTLSRYIWYQ